MFNFKLLNCKRHILNFQRFELFWNGAFFECVVCLEEFQTLLHSVINSLLIDFKNCAHFQLSLL